MLGSDDATVPDRCDDAEVSEVTLPVPVCFVFGDEPE